jgi:hypothetical protein
MIDRETKKSPSTPPTEPKVWSQIDPFWCRYVPNGNERPDLTNLSRRMTKSGAFFLVYISRQVLLEWTNNNMIRDAIRDAIRHDSFFDVSEANQADPPDLSMALEPNLVVKRGTSPSMRGLRQIYVYSTLFRASSILYLEFIWFGYRTQLLF